jgi:predicted DCC family thiol-disulfide oxidoreductase YuxK
MKILFFDSECLYCQFFVRFLLKNTQDTDLKFCSLNSPSADAVKTPGVDSVIFWDQLNNLKSEKSQAVIGVLLLTNSPFKQIAKVLNYFPVWFLDIFYDLVAKMRKLSKKRTFICKLPPGEYESRFIQ